ncbi:MAG TPA: aminotransferase class V-fold PLP-dependent enzyme, partial [Terriglobales bacterium]|nr:aminotransferase class V-fold PLP-dependent enzyme [Terriglobales bacterium]
IDWRAVRNEFPALRNRVFLNTATYGQLPRRAAEAVAEHFRKRDKTACSDFLSWFDDMDRLRIAIARWIGAAADDIAFITSASNGLSTVLSGIDWCEGDELLTLTDEFPNQLYAAESQYGVRSVVRPWPEFEAAISERTRLVLLSTVNYRTGLRPDLSAIIPSLRKRGILVYLDGTQSLGALRFDCGAVQPDFLVVDAYKWMISPNGAGFLYVRPEIREWLRPNIIGWRSDRKWRNVESLHQGAPRFSDTAEKYEGGMLAFPSLMAMAASLTLFEELGSAVIEQRVLQLAGRLRERMSALGADEFPSQPRTLPSQILLFKVKEIDSSRLAKKLEEKHIHVSARREYLRISPHFYNSEEDIGTLFDVLRSA